MKKILTLALVISLCFIGSAFAGPEIKGNNFSLLPADIIPAIDDTYDLGSSTKEWKDLYIDGTANIDSLVADTADINAGTIDGAVIGGTTPAAATFTTAIIMGNQADSAYLDFYADEGDDNNDKWRIKTDDGGNFRIQTYQSGSYASAFHISNSGDATISGGLSLASDQYLTLSANFRLMHDTNSTNDDIPIITFAESNGTAIPILNISDSSFAPNGDATNDNLTEPGIRLWDDDADSWILYGFSSDDTPTITPGGNATGVTVAGTLQNKIKRYYPATLTDTSSPHDLTVAECSNTLISTQGWNGTDDITFNLPDISAYDGSEGVLKVKFLDSVGMQDADTDFYIDPDASTQIVLDGTVTGTDGDRIWIDNPGQFSSISCHSDYDGTLGGYWVCDSINGAFADKGS